MSNYKLVVRGVVSGRSVDEVAEALARMSKRPANELRSLLKSRPMVVKRTAEVEKAVRYKKALEQIGCECMIEAEIKPNSSTASPAPADPSMASISVNVTSAFIAANTPTGPRQFDYAHYPMGARLRSVATVLRLKEWISVGVFASLVLYYYNNYL